MQPRSTTPPIQQSVPGSRPYRLYTVEHVPFGHFPSYREGGPAKVAHGGWSTSTSSQTSMFGGTITEPGHTVHVSRTVSQVPYVSEKHEIDGQVFATDVEAMQAQYEAGVIAYMVYEPGSGHGPDFAEVNDRLVAEAQAAAE